MLFYIPLATILIVLAATLARGAGVKRKWGDRAWALTTAAGTQRLAGAAFAISFAAITFASIVLVRADSAGGRALIAGAFLSIIGAIVVIFAQVQMGRAWRIGVRPGDAPVFVQHGLYRYSRNPIFVGMIAMAAGVAVATGWWWSIAAATVFALACHVQVRIEEAHLSASFGQPYEAFRAAVPRWLVYLRGSWRQPPVKLVGRIVDAPANRPDRLSANRVVAGDRFGRARGGAGHLHRSCGRCDGTQ